MIVIQDTREQRPWDFSKIAGVSEVRIQALATGDYSAVGLEDIVCIERKSLADFAQSVTRGNARFYREIERMQAFPVRAIIIESSITAVIARRYRTQITPAALMSHVTGITCGKNVPVLFAGSRKNAQVLAFCLLREGDKHR